MKLVKQLSEDLKVSLQTANEIWVAVALLNLDGLKFIQSNLPPKCKQHYLIGIDLPTDPKALKELFLQESKSEFIKVKIYSEAEYFHPKVYLIRCGKKFDSFVGSGNCTRGGLRSNVELTVHSKIYKVGTDIKSWYESLGENGKRITLDFLSDYTRKYQDRIKGKGRKEKSIAKDKEKLQEEVEATFEERKKLIKVLKLYRRLPMHKDVLKERSRSVRELKKSLDYPTFKNVDIDYFFSIWALGHIIALPKPTIKREIRKFRKLLRMLCNEDIDIDKRYNMALLNSDYKINGINEGLISKVLAVHNSKKYFVRNGKIAKALSKYGIETPRGISKGEKYLITTNALLKICEEAKVENLAVLDYYLYLEGNTE
jgi:HKD family nuclease